MTSIQPVNAPAFTSRAQQPENQYTGLKTGVVYTGIAGASAYGVKKSVDPLTKWLVNNSRKQIAEITKELKNGGLTLDAEKGLKALKDSMYKNASEMFKLRKNAKEVSLLKAFGMAVPFILGFGLITDLANNYVRKHGQPNATTDKGNEYVKTDIGKKTGFVNGVLAELALMHLNKGALNKLGSTPAQKVATAIIGGIGGFILGSIADKMANKKAAKAADKAAEQAA